MYFWFQVRNFDPDRQATADRLTEDFIAAFSEDLTILKAVHRGLREATSPGINLGIDAASMQARQILNRLIQEEEEAPWPA